MLKKSITYTNPFTDKEVTEEHYFHLSKADMVEMQMEEHNAKYTDKNGTELEGMQAKLQRIIDSEDGKAIMVEFKDMIRRSYGRKEGERFVKNDDIWKEFSSSEAYSQLLFELCTDAAAGAEFFNGVVPNNLEQVAEEVREIAEQRKSDPTGLTAPTPPANAGQVDDQLKRKEAIDNATPENPVQLTRAELVAMDEPVLRDGLATGRYKLS